MGGGTVKRNRLLLAMLIVGQAASAVGYANHRPRHDTRYNPNCAWDSRRSVDGDGNGEPDHFTVAANANFTFPRQLVVVYNEQVAPVLREAGVPAPPIEQIPPFFGGNEGPDDITIYMQGDHRLFGANPAHQPNGEPEQLHNGAIYFKLDYDDVERGVTPTADVRFGIYEANHLVMLCWRTDQPLEDAIVAVCPNGTPIYMQNSEDCPPE